MSEDAPVRSSHDLTAKLWWAVPASAVVLLGFLTMFLGKQVEPSRKRTSYDATSDGFRAAYLILEELDYPVQRSKRISGGTVRWVLFPEEGKDKVKQLETWVRDGGILILGVDQPAFAHNMGMPGVVVNHVKDTPGEQVASGPGIARLAVGNVRVEWPGHTGEEVAAVAGQPAVSIFPRGRGEIWLVHWPELFTNGKLRHADNATLLCRLADEALRRRPGSMAFDEFFHGMRDRPGVLELLLQPPTIWITLQGVLLLGLLLWRFVPRFGTLKNLALPRRRSKEEFLSAMASLLERKRNLGDAYQTVRHNLEQEIERELGLPANTPVGQMVEEAVRRRPAQAEALQRILEALAPAANKLAFLKALNEIESARDEFFNGRHPR